MTLSCCRTVTSQQEFGGQHREFCMTLEGWRMAPYFEHERGQKERANFNNKRHPPRMVGSFG